MNEDRESRLTRRIESFSDLVMGFSIALLSLTLVVPRHTIDFFANPWLIIGYFWTFAVIASLWLTHQRVFSLYFAANAASVAANFIFLSMLGLIVYFVQVFSHMRSSADQVLAFLAYFAALGVAIGSLGLMFLLGVRSRAAVLSSAQSLDGKRRAIRYLIQGSALVIAVLVQLPFVETLTMVSMTSLGFVAAGSFVLSRAINHFLVRS